MEVTQHVSNEECKLIAYQLYDGDLPMQIVPAPRKRQWMDQTPQSFANRCLPLLLGNASGWWLLNTHEIQVTWNGGTDLSALTIAGRGSSETGYALSHFGNGLLTWNIPLLFSTPPGYNLLVRGPANWPKDGAYALDGLVETDHAVATWTMNWKMTRPGLTVTFAKGEPIAQIVPQKRGELETFTPQVRNIREAPELQAAYNAWASSRSTFNMELKRPGSEAVKRQWQKDYFQASHQTKVALKEFTTP